MDNNNEQLKNALDACFGVMMQVSLNSVNARSDQKWSVSVGEKPFLEARARAEKMYYEAIAALQSVTLIEDKVQKLMDDNKEWADATFPGMTALACLKHLKKEVGEAIDELEFAVGVGGEGAALMEFADMYLLLLQGAARKGFTFDQLHTAGVNKMVINRKREWGKLNEEGFSEHIKEPVTLIDKVEPENPFSIERIISYMERTKEEDWLLDKVRSKDGTKHCFFSHLFNMGGSFLWEIFEEMYATTYMIYPVNDGKNEKYQQPTAKERVIAYLKDLRDGKEQTTHRIMEEEYATFKNTKQWY